MQKYFQPHHQHVVILFCIAIISGILFPQCRSKKLLPDPDKIHFDISLIDAQGLRRGEVAVDYEFCIPANDDCAMEVMRITPSARILKQSKGRISCRENQWLVIQSTHSPDWHTTLSRLSRLSFVSGFVETYYE